MPFWFFHMAPYLGGQTPKNPILGAWIGVSSQTREVEKRAYYYNYFIDSNQILHSDKDHCLPNAHRGWSKHTHHKLKMADGRHLGDIEKSLYLGRGSSDYDNIWHDDALRSSTVLTVPTVKNLKFKNPR